MTKTMPQADRHADAASGRPRQQRCQNALLRPLIGGTLD
ncbi:Hypothetical protein ETEE_0562 [Edwardsiella anguillarum ET080813]|uniref:Uncharacterized protein n=1 Tax=Edwardsiella anguillarum ET080813 TaxID=667120 RepID=A0A076LG04_9GAMM|nr:Hypothetical protein ETEE_0562 [Edwardsiella anguillarum ET080813]